MNFKTEVQHSPPPPLTEQYLGFTKKTCPRVQVIILIEPFRYFSSILHATRLMDRDGVRIDFEGYGNSCFHIWLARSIIGTEGCCSKPYTISRQVREILSKPCLRSKNIPNNGSTSLSLLAHQNLRYIPPGNGRTYMPAQCKRGVQGVTQDKSSPMLNRSRSNITYCSLHTI